MPGSNPRPFLSRNPVADMIIQPIQYIAAIEAGGTKFNCALVDMNFNVIAQNSFPTTHPEKTLPAVSDFFHQVINAQKGELVAIGVASFGPVDLFSESEFYGFITNTPKPFWSNTDICGFFSREFNVPIAFETDVNGAAWGEKIAGQAQSLSDFIYVTIGTGIGAGIVANNVLIRGARHPEVGHMLMPRDQVEDNYPGCCPFHGGCLEGLASGKAMESRWQVAGRDLPADHSAWRIEAQYLALMCANLTQILAPQKIILGGGVMNQSQLLPMIHEYFAAYVNGYAPAAVLNNIGQYIVQTQLDGRAAIVGIADLAKRKLALG